MICDAMRIYTFFIRTTQIVNDVRSGRQLQPQPQGVDVQYIILSGRDLYMHSLKRY